MTDSRVVFMYYIGIDDSDKLTIGVVDFYGFVSLRGCTKGIFIINMQLRSPWLNHDIQTRSLVS
jgi:hypothetical protein